MDSNGATSDGGATGGGRPARLAALVVLAAVVLTLVLVPLVALQRGWLPPDDACRHAAFATVSDHRSWSDIAVLRPDAARDQHAPWHGILRAVHGATDASPQGLVVFAVIVLAWAFGLAPLVLMKRPEAWVAALALVASGELLFPSRWMSGRPLVAAMAALVTLLIAFSRRGTGASPPRRLALGVVAFALGAGLHGSWYLFALPVAAFAIAGPVRRAAEVAACWLSGTALAAILTGEPVQAIVSPLHHLQLALFAGSSAPWKVGEFQPSGGAPACVAITAVALLARFQWRRGEGGDGSGELPSAWRDPALVLAAMGWLLGLRMQRTWLDWGAPALACWLALEIEAHLQRRVVRPLPRAAVALVACAALLLATGADRGRRWSGSVVTARLDTRDPALAGWLPEPGGIMYNERMADFYATFLDDPEAPWRWMLAFEPALMPPDDLETYRGIQRSGYDTASFRPWAERMTPKDRMLLHWPFPTPPPLTELQWHRAAGDLWLGRKP